MRLGLLSVECINGLKGFAPWSTKIIGLNFVRSSENLLPSHWRFSRIGGSLCWIKSEISGGRLYSTTSPKLHQGIILTL